MTDRSENSASVDQAVEQYIAELNTSEPVKQMFRRYGVRYAWITMSTVMIAVLATLLTGTIINVAIPEIMGAYGIGQDQAQWLATANLAASTVGMLMTFWMVRAWGLRNMMVVALSAFLFGSVLGGISPSIEVMIIARIIQGVTAGMIAPVSMSIIFTLFPPRQQGTVMGVASLAAILAPALGPTVGGLLIDSFSWRYVYFLGVPFSLLCLPLAIVFLPGRDKSIEVNRFDWAGLIALSIAITFMLLGLTNGEKEGWSSAIIITEFAISFLAWGFFIFWQLRIASPLLNLSIFKFRRFAIFALTSFTFGAGLYGSTYIIPLFLQIVQGMSPTDSGLAMMPAGFLMGVLFPIFGRMADQYDPRTLISWGLVFFFLSFYLMVDADSNTGFWTFVFWMCLGRLGIAIASPAMNLHSVRAVPLHYTDQAAGVLSFVRQLGGAYGVNLLSVMLARRTQFHVDSLSATQAVDNTPMLELLAQFNERLMAAGLTGIEQTAVAMSQLYAVIYTQATIIAFKDTFLLASLVLLIPLIPTWMLKSAKQDAKKSE